MTAAPTEESPRRERERLVTRVYASGAGVRLVLLMALIATSTVTMVQGHLLLKYVLGDPENNLLGCQVAAGFDPTADGQSNFVALLGANSAAYQSCAVRFAPPWWAPFLAVPMVLAAAVVVLWAAPLLRCRARRLEPVAPDSDLGIDLAELSREAGVESRPRFVLDPFTASPTAVTFGRPGRHFVSVSGTLDLCRTDDPRVFRAVVLHELAHLRNGDVNVTMATQALWRAFAVIMLLPFLAELVRLWIAGFARTKGYTDVYLLVSDPRDVLLALFTAALVYLSRSDVLCSREFHADHLAVRLGADPAVWDDLSSHVARPRGTAVSRLRALAPHHPSWRRRQRCVHDPERLVAIRPLTVVLTGIAAMLISTSLHDAPGPSLGSGRVVGATGAAVLVVGVLGTMLWTGARRTFPTGGAATPLRLGALLALGFSVGDLFTRWSYDVRQWVPDSLWPSGSLWLLTLGLTLWGCGGIRIAVTGSPGRRRDLATGVLAVGAVTALAFFLNWYQAAKDVFRPGVLDLAEQSARGAFGLTSHPAALITGYVLALSTILATTAVVPAAALWFGLVLVRSLSGRSDEARRPALRIGAGVGAATLVVCLVVDAVGAGSTHGFAVLCLLVAAVLVGPVAAAVACSLRRPDGVTAGVVAAGSAGLTIALGVVATALVPHLEGWFLDGAFTRNALTRQALGSSVIAGLVAATLVTALALALRRTPAAIRPPAAVAPGTPEARGVPVLLTAALVIAVAVPSFTTATATAQEALPPSALSDATAAPPSDPLVLGAQKYAWMRYGGLDILGDFIGDVGSLGQGLARLERDPTDRAGLRGACAHVRITTRAAKDHFRVPDPREQEVWSRFIATADGASDGCLQALGDDDQSRLDVAIEQMSTAATLFEEVMTWLAPPSVAPPRTGG